MKTFKKGVVGFLLAALLGVLLANPMIEYFLNELLMDPTDPYNWQLEIETVTDYTLDGWYLTTLSDTAYFKEGIIVTGFTPVVFTNDSLQQPLSINPQGDVLRIYSPYDMRDEMRFGDVEESQVAAPKPGQSICRYKESTSLTYNGHLYLDNSPTLGSENDSQDATGTIHGLVTDEYGNGLSGVKVIYEERDDAFVYFYTETDDEGYYTVNDNAWIEELRFEKEGYYAPYEYVQIWPDSTVEHTTVMEDTTTNTFVPNRLPVARDYRLNQNYPNPFNGRTVFTYALPLADFIEIAVYDLNGRKIASLYSGYQAAGRHRITWNADAYGSGVYIYRLITSQKTLSKKCLLLK